MEPTPADLAEFKRGLDSMPMSQVFDAMTKSMVRFVFKHAGQPIKEMRSEINEQRAEIVELRRRVAELESKNG